MMAGAADSKISNRPVTFELIRIEIIRFKFESNLEASQDPTQVFHHMVKVVRVIITTVDCSGYLHRVFHHTVKVVQVCSEMIETVDFPRPDSAASLNQQKVKLNDGQRVRVRDTTLHHQIRGDDVPQVRSSSVPSYLLPLSADY